MYEFIASLTPVQQGALAGFLAALLLSLIKKLWPGSCDTPEEVTAWTRRLLSIVTAAIGTLVVQAAAPPLTLVGFLTGVITAWFASQGFFGLGKAGLSLIPATKGGK